MMNDKPSVSLTTNALRKHVLLAEDNKNFSFLMKKQLEEVGIRCSIAQNGFEAQHIFGHETFRCGYNGLSYACNGWISINPMDAPPLLSGADYFTGLGVA